MIGWAIWIIVLALFAWNVAETARDWALAEELDRVGGSRLWRAANLLPVLLAALCVYIWAPFQ